MIERWIATLHNELDLTAEEIADITWLALIQHRASKEQQSIQAGLTTTDNGHRQFSENKGNLPSRFPTSPSSSEGYTSRQQTGVFPRWQQWPKKKFASKRQTGVPIKVMSAPAIRDPLAIIRAMRPLIRQVSTGEDAGLDEVATAQRIADECIWMPVTKPAVEPWLELALIIDESPSMLIWRRTVLELQRLLKHYGAFRDVRTWGMVAVEMNDDESSELVKQQVYIRPEFSGRVTQQSLRCPEELIDPNGRRLVLVVTDCVSALWREGTVLSLLKIWADQGPLAIVQMLPEWMWVRTALRQAADAQFYGLEPGLANQRLSVNRSPLLDETIADSQQSEVRTPIVTLEPEPIGIWSHVVAGKGNVYAPGVIFKPSLQSAWAQVERRRKTKPTPEPTPEQRVQRFKAASTPMARQLAGLVAAAPVIHLPVIRLIQDILLPESRQVHVAEVLLGGLLTPVAPSAPGTNPDDVIYEFVEPQIRSILLDGAPVTDTTEVLSKYVTRHLGKASLDVFIAELRLWIRGETTAEGDDLRPFAVMAADVLKRWGGRYADFVREVDQWYESPSREGDSSDQEDSSLHTKVFNFPFSRNPFFTGRETLLESIHAGLTSRGRVALSGLGGIGKTQIALEYAYRHQQEYDQVFWVRAEQKEELISGYVDVAKGLQIPGCHQEDQLAVVSLLKQWLTTHDDWLLVLDNADNLRQVRPFLPTASGHILLTTRVQALGDLAQPLEVNQMEVAEGALFLLRR